MVLIARELLRFCTWYGAGEVKRSSYMIGACMRSGESPRDLATCVGRRPAFVSCIFVLLLGHLYWQDDQRILWEGVSSLTKQELQVSADRQLLNLRYFVCR